MSAIPVNLAVEDDLSEAVLKRLLMHTARGFAIGTVYGHSGYGYLRSWWLEHCGARDSVRHSY